MLTHKSYGSFTQTREKLQRKEDELRNLEARLTKKEQILML